MPPEESRSQRLYEEAQSRFRTEGERDRDRVLYSSALRRLAEVTQVVAPSEGHVFHNRLTHTLEVAQIGRRLAQKLTDANRDAVSAAIAREIATADPNLAIDPDVVEAAALLHDLGHPPFGHVAEMELNRLMLRAGHSDGYEGNAQSLRIAAALEVQNGDAPQGLNLTRATLRASLKYTCVRPTEPKEELSEEEEPHLKKWGAYRSEERAFRFALGGDPDTDTPSLRELSRDSRRSVEAELMDWADDVAYSVHDVEDFFRAGLVPLDRVMTNYADEQQWFLAKADTKGDPEGYKQAFLDLVDGLKKLGGLITAPYRDRQAQRVRLNELKSTLISRYIDGISLAPEWREPRGNLRMPEELEREVHMLKQLVWVYVIRNPALGTQQMGQVRIIRTLFHAFERSSRSIEGWMEFPERFQEQLEAASAGGEVAKTQRLRIVADLVASLTEQQATSIFQRITGGAPGSVLDALA